jgi:pimeloyl-ACP methyl ester carboxylesterase
MIFVRQYGSCREKVIVVHGGPGAAGHMARVARALSDCYEVIEPFQRRSSGERLTVARHVADLHEVVGLYAGTARPALVGASWGAMLTLAYAAEHPDASGPLVLVGCGTFDPVARAELQKTIAERMTDDIRADLEKSEHLGGDQGLRASARAMNRIYSYDLMACPHHDDEIDARGHDEAWRDMVRLQERGIYPASFSTITAPVLMVHGAYDPHPGRLIFRSLKPFVPHLEYRELEQCGHYPWLERAAAGTFFSVVRHWLRRHIMSP